MASELRVNTLKDASGNNSVGMSTVAEGSCKAWLAATDAAVLYDSFNISSSTDEGTGDYKYGVSNAFVRSTAETGAFGIALGYSLVVRFKTAEAATNVIDVELFLSDASSQNPTNGHHAVGILGDLA